MEIKFKKLVPEAQTPTKSHEADAGFDFYCTSIEWERNYTYKYHTGIAVDIPQGMVGLAFPRSSIIKKQLMLKNSVGVIDSGYVGEIIFIFHNTINNLPMNIFPTNYYQVGDRIGQMVFLELPKITLVESDQLSDTERGSGGFGSTNK